VPSAIQSKEQSLQEVAPCRKSPLKYRKNSPNNSHKLAISLRHSFAYRLPEILALSLQQPALPAHIYRYILNFLATNPTPQQIIDFRPTLEMQERMRTLLGHSKAGELTPLEQKELDEYERIDHLVIMLKAGSLFYLTSTP
jgi:hypothetical protein